MTLQELGRQDEAMAAWQELAASVGDSPLVQAHLGLARLQSGDPAGALADLRRARDGAGGRRRPLPVDLHIARALEALDRTAEARLELEGYLARSRVPAVQNLETAAARQRLADLLAGDGAAAERVASLHAEAQGIRSGLAPAILESAATRLTRDGPGAARAFLEQQAALDPGLPAALQDALSRRGAAGRPAADELRTLVNTLAAAPR
jgi:hypothetical protein